MYGDRIHIHEGIWKNEGKSEIIPHQKGAVAQENTERIWRMLILQMGEKLYREISSLILQTVLSAPS